MAIIYSYPLVTSLSDSDLMLITSRDNDNELFTGSVKYETLKDSILSSFDGTDNYIPKFSQGALVNSNIYQGGTNIGIGTNSPNNLLEIETEDGSGVTGDDGIFVKTPQPGVAPTIGYKQPFISIGTSDETGATSTIYLGEDATATGQETKIEYDRDSDTLGIFAKGQGTYREHVRFGNPSSTSPRTYFSGDVGIGTNAPSQELDVVGSIEVSDGIYIGGTAAANKLDDYEKGEFTPVLTTSGTEPSITTKQGRYTKIGDTVFVEIRLRDFVSENESNAVTGCTNLPFTVLDTLSSTFVTGNAFGSNYSSNSTYAGRQYVYALDNTTTLTFRNGELLGIGFEADTNSEISVSIIYKTA